MQVGILLLETGNGRVEKLIKIDVVALLQPGEAQLLFGATY